MYTKRRMEIHPVLDKEKLRWIENPNFFPSFLPSFLSFPSSYLAENLQEKRKPPKAESIIYHSVTV
jgi:hypothetical protein